MAVYISKEGWGLAVVEAAQHAVPTIGYRSSGGLADSIIDGVTGVLVDGHDELVGRLQQLLTDPVLRDQLGVKAQARSTSNELPRLVPNLVEAMFTGFPGNNGETLHITVMPERARNT